MLIFGLFTFITFLDMLARTGSLSLSFARARSPNLTKKMSMSGSTLRNSSTIPTLVKYFKDKGVYIPFSKTVLYPDEHERYLVYREIKLGHKEKVKQLLEKTPRTKEEKETLIECIEDLQDQPYSIPNFLIGYWFFNGAWYLGEYWASVWKNGMEHPEIMPAIIANSEALPWAMGVGSAISVAWLGYHGLHVIYDEFRAPYYDYDGLIEVIKDAPIKEDD